MSKKATPTSTRLTAPTSKARYIMIGGFLGAGKTTAIARLARYLTDEGLRVGLITNDQGSNLVDTAMLSARGFPVEEIAGGCFCCRFNSLTEAAQKLSDAKRPDVFIAEPVGSCTDLIATVSYPLRRIYGSRFAIAPFSVMVDPVRALRVLGLENGPAFSEKVRYIYRKQLEEAHVIVVNKCDQIEPPRVQRLREALEEQFTNAELFEVSARTGDGLQMWFPHIMAASQPLGQTIAVDYDTYAEGEALLGWLNATIQLSSASSFDGNALLRQFADMVQRRIAAAGGEVAHLKMTLDPESGFGDLATINLVRNDFVPELSQELPEPILDGRLIVNLRAEADPARLEACLHEGVNEFISADPRMLATIDHVESFRPGRPVPVHRLESGD
jgi:Ni2+-binding GTPase involved in maturation of urease and hydrogenase